MSEAAERLETAEPNSNLVRYTVDDGVAVLTLNDPPANTYSYEMMQSARSRHPGGAHGRCRPGDSYHWPG